MCKIVRYQHACKHGFKQCLSRCGRHQAAGRPRYRGGSDDDSGGGDGGARTKGAGTRCGEAYITIRLESDCSGCLQETWTKQQRDRLSRAEKFRDTLLLPTSASTNTTDIYTHISELVTELHNDFDTALWNRRSQYSSFAPSPYHPCPLSTPPRSSPRTSVADGALAVVDMQKAKPVLGYRRTKPSRLRLEVRPEDIVAAVSTAPGPGDSEGEDWAQFCSEEYMEDPLHPISPIYDEPLPVDDDEYFDDDDGGGSDLQSAGWEMDWGGGFDGDCKGNRDDVAEGDVPADDGWEGEREKEGEEDETQRTDSLNDMDEKDEKDDEDHATNNYRQLPRPQQRPTDKTSKTSLEKVVKQFWSTVDGVHQQNLDAHTPPDHHHHDPLDRPAERIKHTLNRYDRYRQANKSAFMRNHPRLYYANQLLLSRLEIKTKLGANAVGIRTLQGDVRLEDMSFST